MVCLLVINFLLWFTSMQVQIFFLLLPWDTIFLRQSAVKSSINHLLYPLKVCQILWNCSSAFFSLFFLFVCLFRCSLQQPSVRILKARFLARVFEEGALKHLKHLSLVPLKCLIEIVFTKQAPRNKYIHPLLASKHTSYTGFSTFLNLTDAQLHSHMPVPRRMKNNTDFFSAGYLCLTVLQFLF